MHLRDDRKHCLLKRIFLNATFKHKSHVIGDISKTKTKFKNHVALLHIQQIVLYFQYAQDMLRCASSSLF